MYMYHALHICRHSLRSLGISARKKKVTRKKKKSIRQNQFWQIKVIILAGSHFAWIDFIRNYICNHSPDPLYMYLALTGLL